MTVRKIASILLSASIIFTLAGCGGQSRAETPSVSQPSCESVGAENTPAESPSQPSGQPAGGADGQVENPPSDNSGSGAGKTLVVYYSATGHTDAVAGYIAEALGGDLFKLEPAEPYSSDDLNWTDGDSGKLLAEAAGTGNWLEGQRFSSGASQAEVQEWVEGLVSGTAGLE